MESTGRGAVALLASFVVAGAGVALTLTLGAAGSGDGSAGPAGGSAGAHAEASAYRADRMADQLVAPAGEARPGDAAGAPAATGTPPPGRRLTARPVRVLVYGDSLGWESYPRLEAGLAAAGAVVTGQTFPMTALCDWLPAMAGTVVRTRPDLLVLVFNGNRRTACMQGQDGRPLSGQPLSEKYRRDALTAVGVATRAGAWTLLVGGPVFRADSAQIGAGRAYEEIAARVPGVSYVDAGEAVAPGHRFAARLPCESLDRGHCDADGTVAVRSADGIHFCPGDGGARRPCPVWSSGAFRYAAAIDTAASRLLGLR